MKIRGNTVGFPNPQPNWNQTDSTQADYIKNKPFETVSDVLDQMAVSVIDFSGLESGTFTETLGGEQISHAVTYDADGRPTAIDNITITWGDS